MLATPSSSYNMEESGPEAQNNKNNNNKIKVQQTEGLLLC